MRATRLAVIALVVLLLTGCGSTSEIKPATTTATPDKAASQKAESGQAKSAAAAAAPTEATPAIELSTFARYNKVVVLDFEDGVDKSKIPADKQAAYADELNSAVRNFADRIASEIRQTNSFESVAREASGDDAVRISGVITRYATGNALLRLFIGLGAGSSYFDAVVDLSDNVTGEKLGQVIVDRNSWGLGGGIAAGQTVEGFMESAAKKIAKQLADARKPPPPAK